MKKHIIEGYTHIFTRPGRNGFGHSDWPIWTDFVGGNFRLQHFFFGDSYKENLNCSGSENNPKDYRSAKC